MKRTTTRLTYVLLSGTALLAGCASREAELTTFDAPKRGDEGVVIAEAALIEGMSSGNSVVGATDDCAGPGLGVVVNTTLSDDHFLFNKKGEPCEAAQTLFDGRRAVNQRQTDPAITLRFFDNIGPKPTTLPELEPVPTVRLKSELLPSISTIEPAAGPGQPVAKAVPVQTARATPDPVAATLAAWKNQDAVYATRSSEASLAAERNLKHIVNANRDENSQATISKLMAELRERERQVQEEQRRHAETLERAQRNRQITRAVQTEWQQKEAELQNNLVATQQRLLQFEALNKRLNAEKAQKEDVYQQKISTLSADLKAAEQQADASRRELILQAAAKIAEAEQLASAANIQEQQLKLREAARLKAEAETMMDRALAMNAGQVTVAGVGAPPAVPLPLMQTPVVVVANGKTLPEIITDVLKQAVPQAGEWKADWQLSGKASHILKEKWSLTAEAPVEQVLAQLNQQVKAAHGVTLTFTQFGQSQLLVVTDATPPLRQ